MRKINKYAALAVGGVAFALTLYLLMTFPGLVSDQASTVPVQTMQEQRR